MTDQADMSSARPCSAEFLETLSRAATGGSDDRAALGAWFADTFLAGDIDGSTRPVPREMFVSALPARTAAARAAGIGPAALVEVQERPLGGSYWLLSTWWAAPRTDGEDLAMASTFLTADTEDGMRVVAYLTHHGLPHRMS